MTTPMRCRFLCPLLALFVLSSCEEGQPAAPLNAEPFFAIEDAIHGGGNEHFYWLPPMITPAPACTGVFDASADPTIEVCAWSGSACLGDPLLTITAASGITVNTVDEWFGVDWYVFDHDPVEGDVYRISVSASGQQLGFADLMIVDKVTGQLRNTLGDDYILLSENNGRKFLKIRFRVEEGATTGGGELYAQAQLWTPGGVFGVAVFDIRDLTSIRRVRVYENVPVFGLAVSKDGTAYVAGPGGSADIGVLDVYDSDFNLIGSVTVDPADVDGINSFIIDPQIGPSGLVFACNPARGPQARIFVFNVDDPTDPQLINVEDIHPVVADGRECRGPTFDSQGNLWVFGAGLYGGMTKMEFDTGGDLLGWEYYPGMGGHGMAIEPGEGRLFWSWVNNDKIQFVLSSDPATMVGTITDVCGTNILSPGAMRFSQRGDLFVGCSNYEGVTTDLVVFRKEDLAGLTGVHLASSLNPVIFEDEALPNGFGWMAMR